MAVFETYAAAASRLAPLGSSQLNEAFNQVATSKHPKRVHYGRSKSMPFRIAAAVCQMNEGVSYVNQVQEKLEISPGEHTVKFRAAKDRKRERKASRLRTQLFKTNRITKKKARKFKRLGAERKEGVTYSSGCGFAVPDLNDGYEDDDPLPLPDLPPDFDFENADNSATAYVVFDVETTGFGKLAQIVQIAAEQNGTTFSRYILPSRDMDAGASAATGLIVKDGKLLLHGEAVPTVTQKRAHIDFLDFLQQRKMKVVLVAHNGWRFDAPLLCHAVKEMKLWDRFQLIVTGFVDTLYLFRKKLASAKPPSFTQSALATFYNVPNVGAHNAVNDCEVLSAILRAGNVDDSELKDFCKDVNFKAREDLDKIRKSEVSKTYQEFGEYVKSTTFGKLAAANIALAQLREAYREGGGDRVRQILMEDVQGKPRITKCKTVIERIIEGIRRL